MNYQEIPIVFTCEGCRLVGIVTKPEAPSQTGVVIVVGGPQYRSGSHRQFTLLARDLARNGHPSLRFDYRGMGDSEGAMRTFESVDEDLRSAIDAFLAIGTGIERVVIWGLCDAASAALYYASTDSRVKGLVLLNPWVHTEAGEARARIKHYYVERFLQKSFWVKLVSGDVKLISSVLEFSKAFKFIFDRVIKRPANKADNIQTTSDTYIDRMRAGLDGFSGHTLIILSENDIGAQEFTDLLNNDKKWRNACQSPKTDIINVPEANHTFSSRVWRDHAARLTREWLDKSLGTH